MDPTQPHSPRPAAAGGGAAAAAPATRSLNFLFDGLASDVDIHAYHTLPHRGVQDPDLLGRAASFLAPQEVANLCLVSRSTLASLVHPEIARDHGQPGGLILRMQRLKQLGVNIEHLRDNRMLFEKILYELADLNVNIVEPHRGRNEQAISDLQQLGFDFTTQRSKDRFKEVAVHAAIHGNVRLLETLNRLGVCLLDIQDSQHRNLFELAIRNDRPDEVSCPVVEFLVHVARQDRERGIRDISVFSRCHDGQLLEDVAYRRSKYGVLAAINSIFPVRADIWEQGVISGVFHKNLHLLNIVFQSNREVFLQERTMQIIKQILGEYQIPEKRAPVERFLCDFLIHSDAGRFLLLGNPGRENIAKELLWRCLQSHQYRVFMELADHLTHTQVMPLERLVQEFEDDRGFSFGTILASSVTPIYGEEERGLYEAVFERLLQEGRILEDPGLLSKPDRGGRTLAVLAAKHENHILLEKLFERFGPRFLQEEAPKGNWTPLMRAVENRYCGSLHTVEFFWRVLGEEEFFRRNSQGKCAIELVAQNPIDFDVLAFLMKSINKSRLQEFVNAQGESLAEIACRHQNRAFILQLEEAGIPTDAAKAKYPVPELEAISPVLPPSLPRARSGLSFDSDGEFV